MERFLIWLVLAVQGSVVVGMYSYLVPDGPDSTYGHFYYGFLMVTVGGIVPLCAAVWVGARAIVRRWERGLKQDTASL